MRMGKIITKVLLHEVAKPISKNTNPIIQERYKIIKKIIFSFLPAANGYPFTAISLKMLAH